MSSLTAEPAASRDSTGRYNDLMQYCREIARRGSQDPDSYNSVKTLMQELLNRLTIQPKECLARSTLVKPNNSSSTAELASELQSAREHHQRMEEKQASSVCLGE